MLTLVITALATAYFVVPELLTRYVGSFYFVFRVDTSSRSESIQRSAITAIFWLLLAWSFHGCGWHRFAILRPVPTNNIVWATKTVFEGLDNDIHFPVTREGFYAAARTFWYFNLFFLLRTYALIVFAWIVAGLITQKLGVLPSKFFRKLFIGRVSEWHVALSPMMTSKGLAVRPDVMMKNGTLYRGFVMEKRVSSDGNLAMVMLSAAERMLRDDLKRDEEAFEKNQQIPKPDREKYWRRIPGEMFLIQGTEISTVNIRHVEPDVAAMISSTDNEYARIARDMRTKVKAAKEKQQKQQLGTKKGSVVTSSRLDR